MTKDEALLMTLATLEEGNFVYPTALRTAIEEALAQPEQEPVGLDKYTLRDMAGAAFETAMAFGISTDSFERLARDVNKRIVAALAQPEQEPQLTSSGIHKIGCVNHDCQHCKEMKDWEGIAADQAMTIALMKSEQEPVATVAEVHMSRYTIEWINGSLPEGTKLYTAPPKRKEWVGLTDVDIFEAEFNRPELMTIGEFISNKLKELNT